MFLTRTICVKVELKIKCTSQVEIEVEESLVVLTLPELQLDYLIMANDANNVCLELLLMVQRVCCAKTEF